MEALTLQQRARLLRKNQTEAEQRIWYHLRAKRFFGLKFRRQYIIEPYIVDFICLENNLIVEIDGGQHNVNKTYDERRTSFLENKGYKVVRFWNHEVLSDTHSILNALSLTLSHRRGD